MRLEADGEGLYLFVLMGCLTLIGQLPIVPSQSLPKCLNLSPALSLLLSLTISISPSIALSG